LVEGSETQYNRLIKNYGDRNGVEMIFDLITPDGSDVEFFEGGGRYDERDGAQWKLRIWRVQAWTEEGRGRDGEERRGGQEG